MPEYLTNLVGYILVPAALIWMAAWAVCRVAAWHRADQPEPGVIARERASREAEWTDVLARTEAARFDPDLYDWETP